MWRRNAVTCRRRRMYSCKIHYEHSPCQAFDRPIRFLDLAHEPHEHVVLWISRVMSYWENGLTNRLIVPVLSILLHLRKSSLNRMSDIFNFLSDLGGKVR